MEIGCAKTPPRRRSRRRVKPLLLSHVEIEKLMHSLADPENAAPFVAPSRDKSVCIDVFLGNTLAPTATNLRRLHQGKLGVIAVVRSAAFDKLTQEECAGAVKAFIVFRYEVGCSSSCIVVPTVAMDVVAVNERYRGSGLATILVDAWLEHMSRVHVICQLTSRVQPLLVPMMARRGFARSSLADGAGNMTDMQLSLPL